MIMQMHLHMYIMRVCTPNLMLWNNFFTKKILLKILLLTFVNSSNELIPVNSLVIAYIELYVHDSNQGNHLQLCYSSPTLLDICNKFDLLKYYPVSYSYITSKHQNLRILAEGMYNFQNLRSSTSGIEISNSHFSEKKFLQIKRLF